MVAGYYVALERTLFAEEASDEHMRLWDINCKVHDRGKELLVPPKICCNIARLAMAIPLVCCVTNTAVKRVRNYAKTAIRFWNLAW